MTAQRIQQHELLQIHRNLGIRNHDFRENGMCPAAFPAFDAENTQDNGTLPCFQATAVIPVTNQAAGVPAAAPQPVQRKICCDFSVNFWCYPLETFEISCYHDDAVFSNDFWPLLVLCEQERTFSGCSSCFCNMCRLWVFIPKPTVMIPYDLCV